MKSQQQQQRITQTYSGSYLNLRTSLTSWRKHLIVTLVSIIVSLHHGCHVTKAFVEFRLPRTPIDRRTHQQRRLPSSSLNINRNLQENHSTRNEETLPTSSPDTGFDRRAVLNQFVATSLAVAGTTISSLTYQPQPAYARAPGSTNANEAIQQIKDGKKALETLLDNFDTYAQIDSEGRAKSTDEARRILGGIAPQGGTVAIEVAKATPLYRIDGAFTAVRKTILDADEKSSSDDSWGLNMDLFAFEELAEKLVYELSKADGDFYSVLFASKGTTMIRDIFVEAKSLVKQGIKDFDAMLDLLRDAGAPGV